MHPGLVVLGFRAGHTKVHATVQKARVAPRRYRAVLRRAVQDLHEGHGCDLSISYFGLRQRRLHVSPAWSCAVCGNRQHVEWHLSYFCRRCAVPYLQLRRLLRKIDATSDFNRRIKVVHTVYTLMHRWFTHFLRAQHESDLLRVAYVKSYFFVSEMHRLARPFKLSRYRMYKVQAACVSYRRLWQQTFRRILGLLRRCLPYDVANEVFLFLRTDLLP